MEIILRLDSDDNNSISRIKELPIDKIDINIIIDKRYGYEFLYKYVNEMCEKTVGEFILWFNDDCIIETKGWDEVIAKYTGKIVCFNPNHKGTGSGNIFPLISRKIYEILGHFSLSQQVDSWQDIVGQRAGIEVKLDNVVFIHNRKQDYVSDDDREEVLKRTLKVWIEVDERRIEDAEKIKKYLGE